MPPSSPKAQLKADFNRAAHRYDAYARFQRTVCKHLWQLCMEHHSDFSGTILDAGCGTGYLHELLRSKRHSYPLIQCDIATAMCEVAASYAAPKEYGITHTVAADMEALPFAEASLGLLFSSMVWQWCHSLETACSEASRTLKTPGMLALAVPVKGSLKALQATLHTRYGTLDFFPESRSLLQHIADEGFHVLHEDVVDYQLEYSALLSLLRDLHKIGGRAKSASSSPLTKGRLLQLETTYRTESCALQGPLYAKWRIAYVIAGKR